MSQRESLVNLLKRYRPTDEEVQTKEKMIAFVEANENCFHRSFLEGHITGSSWLLSSDGEKALLLHHAKLDRWVQPGGHADGDPDVLNVSVKEAREESGIDEIAPVSVEIFDIDIHSVSDHLHYDIRFLLQIQKDTPPIQNRESKGFLWVTKKDTLPTKERSIVRMHEKWRLR